MPEPTFLARLKESTRPLHEATETSVDLSTGLKSLDGYRQLLERYLGFVEPAEDRLGEIVAGVVPDFPARRKANLLRRDLIALGVDPAAIAALPRCDDFPEMTPLPRAMGCLYVLEGSTLGGQYMAKHVESTLGLSQDAGSAYLRSYGENVGPMWKRFGAILTEQASDEPAALAIIDGAHEMFGAFGRWFTAIYV